MGTYVFVRRRLHEANGTEPVAVGRVRDEGRGRLDGSREEEGGGVFASFHDDEDALDLFGVEGRGCFVVLSIKLCLDAKILTDRLYVWVVSVHLYYSRGARGALAD